MTKVRVTKVVTMKIRLRAHKDDHQEMVLCDSNNPRTCRWAVALTKAVPGASKPWIDAGHIRFTLDGWRWTGDTPRQIKADLISLDKWLHLPKWKRSEIPPPFDAGPFVVRVMRKGPARKATQAELEKMSRRRYARIAAGKPDKPTKKYTFHDRVVGYA